MCFSYHVATFDIHVLSAADGTWDRFKADWQKQCEEVGEAFDEYAADSLKIVAGVITGELISVGGGSVTRVGALWDSDSERYYACCMLNRVTGLPGIDGPVLRVRHLIVSPLIDYGVGDVEMYPDVLIGILQGVVHLSSTSLNAGNIHLHLRSPEDQSFFRAFGTSLGASGVFASVQTRGAWLYVTKTTGVGTSEIGETES